MLTLLSSIGGPIVTKEEAKARLRELTDDFDVEIEDLIETATDFVAHDSGRALRQGQYLFSACRWCSPMFVPLTPVRGIAEISYLDDEGDEIVVDDGLYRWTRSEAGDGVLVWFEDAFTSPALIDRTDAVSVTLDAGYDEGGSSGSGDDPELSIPRQARQAVFLLVGHWFRNKEAVGTVGEKIAIGLDALLSQIRIYR